MLRDQIFGLTNPRDIAKAMVAPGKSILAADESPSTAESRIKRVGLPYSPELMHRFRSFAFKSDGLHELVGGVILHEDTLGMFIDNMLVGTFLANVGILAGCKVDTGLVDFPGHPGQKRTTGLDGLQARLKSLKESFYVRFAKARSVFAVEGLTEKVIEHNARWQATYAAICLEQGIVPIVEPEVLADGPHSIYACRDATYAVLERLYTELSDRKIPLSQVILKPNMVTPGLKSGQQIDPYKVASSTFSALGEFRTTPLAGIAFLSGGLSPDDATNCLRVINAEADDRMTYTGSFGRASQQEALEVFSRLQGEPAHVQRSGVQEALLDRLRRVSMATRGMGTGIYSYS